MLSKKRKIKGACVHYAVRLGKLVTPGTLFLCQSFLGDKAGRKWSILNVVYSRGHLHLGTFNTFFFEKHHTPFILISTQCAFPHFSFSYFFLKYTSVEALIPSWFSCFFPYILCVFPLSSRSFIHNFSFLLNLKFFLILYLNISS